MAPETAKIITAIGGSMKDYSSLCMHCMLDTNGLDVCPHCGRENTDTATLKHHLVPGTVLARGRYIVGRSILILDKEIWYAGFDTVADTRVFIREYYVQKYITRRSKSGNIVADDFASDAFEDAKKKFKAQLKIEMSLNSSYTTDIDKVFIENNTVYAITEWLDGMSMSDYLKENQTCPSLYVIQNLSQQIGDALQALNVKGYAHTHLSPECIWMCKNGTVRVIDYSYIQPLSKRRKVSRNKPNPFVAQEVCNSKAKLTPAADVYSLAVIMYTIITGNIPYNASEESLKSSLSNVQLPQAMKVAIIKALSYSPTARYKSIKDFLRNFAQNKPADRRKGMAYKEKKSRAHLKLNAVGIVASALVMLLGLLFILMPFALKTINYYYYGDVSDEIKSSIEKACSITNKEHILYGFKQTDDINVADMIIYAANQSDDLCATDIEFIDCNSLCGESSVAIIQKYIEQQKGNAVYKLPIDIIDINEYYIYYKSGDYKFDENDSIEDVVYIELQKELFGKSNDENVSAESSVQSDYPKIGIIETQDENSEVNFREEPNTAIPTEECKKLSGNTEINIIGSIELKESNPVISGDIRLNGKLVSAQDFPKEKISKHNNSTLWYCIEYPTESGEYGFVHSNYIKIVSTSIGSEANVDSFSTSEDAIAIVYESDAELSVIEQFLSNLPDSNAVPKYKSSKKEIGSIEEIEFLLNDSKFVIAKFIDNANPDIGCIGLNKDGKASVVHITHFISFVKNDSINRDLSSEFVSKIIAESSRDDTELNEVMFMN